MLSMNRTVMAAAFATAWLASPAFAADLNGPGSVKDGPVYARAAGPCYVRGDVGYSWSNGPDATFTQTDGVGTFLTNSTSSDIDNTWLAGVGFGCSSGPRGLRGEVMFDWRGDRDLTGTLATAVGSAASGSAFRTSIQTQTIMFNAYYDLGQWNRMVPYIGAGVGVARNDMDSVVYSALPNSPVAGDDKWSLAWSLMAGTSFQLSDRVILDLGYRYIDMGKAESGTIDTLGAANPPLRVDDLTAHEFKVGLRIHFGG
jgi:opacity protein-like surface antigen